MNPEARSSLETLAVAGWCLVMPAVPTLVSGTAGAALAVLGLSLGFVVAHVLAQREMRLAQKPASAECPMRSLVPPVPQQRHLTRP